MVRSHLKDGAALEGYFQKVAIKLTLEDVLDISDCGRTTTSSGDDLISWFRQLDADRPIWRLDESTRRKALFWIAHNGQVSVAFDDLAKQPELCVGRVLEFVGHDKAIGVLHDAQSSGL